MKEPTPAATCPYGGVFVTPAHEPIVAVVHAFIQVHPESPPRAMQPVYAKQLARSAAPPAWLLHQPAPESAKHAAFEASTSMSTSRSESRRVGKEWVSKW